MPELPEAETVRAQLEPLLVGQTIVQSWARLPRITLPSIDEFIARTRNQKIVAAKRRGKQIYFPLESGDNLLIHLGMTGKLHVDSTKNQEEFNSEALHKHIHGALVLSNQTRLIFTDSRTFGKLAVSRDLPFLKQMGPEPLDEDFDIEAVSQKIKKKAVRIKAAILDQTLIAGLGNIYADEVCFLAHIHPETRAIDIPIEKLRELVSYMRPTLEKAIKARGATLKDGGYQDTFGEFGEFIPQIYGRVGDACDECGTLIQRGTLGAGKTARSYHFCKKCQLL
ncbi:DNA-(apurinic or apyrimidinic site) lyase [Abditibacterium utsteinense]|uniref:Formamidopyrimidine-DNA glycosylase n=1 Tax=Abditibacterium utsteinense TaxID=1960156 RepID=A0A2S8SXM5_9BACT|nr:bifunctional DNA-formamidopyrimidine glycosylase/DNA-(apurinic or apyrimidinic site) lyase [Abditibacterium utsteinense]PQV65555.1 DNA-(apurinic or apyrimidinic site) lyase [Abditibacterium utsteinense]